VDIILIVIPVSIVKTAVPSFSVPIVPFCGLPTEKSAWIVLDGNQRFD
jgi:hypothetical protein